MIHLFIDILRNSILITGLVVVMMMMIESLNIESGGLFFKGLRKTKVGQVIFGAVLGSIPGCMGGLPQYPSTLTGCSASERLSQ